MWKGDVEIRVAGAFDACIPPPHQGWPACQTNDRIKEWVCVRYTGRHSSKENNSTLVIFTHIHWLARDGGRPGDSIVSKHFRQIHRIKTFQANHAPAPPAEPHPGLGFPLRINLSFLQPAQRKDNLISLPKQQTWPDPTVIEIQTARALPFSSTSSPTVSLRFATRARLRGRRRLFHVHVPAAVDATAVARART